MAGRGVAGIGKARQGRHGRAGVAGRGGAWRGAARLGTAGHGRHGKQPEHVVTSDIEWTRERLRNWGAWSRTARTVHVAYSAEGRYRPERLHQDEEADRRRARGEVDVNDALHVWRAIMPQHGMPLGMAFVLHGVYTHKHRGESLRGFLHKRGMTIRGRDLDATVHQAEFTAHNRIARLDIRVNRRDTPYQSADIRPRCACITQAEVSTEET